MVHSICEFFINSKPITLVGKKKKMDRPNVIFILVDDLGWAELGCYGNRYNETPHIDNLAATGMRFTNAYASSTVCSPSRAGLLTGQAPPRIGITDYLRPNSEWFLPLDSGKGGFADNELPEDTDFRINPKILTLAEMFRIIGYFTCIIGKWHLSGYDKKGVKFGPEKYGFDEVRISEQKGIAGGSYFHPYTKIDPNIETVLGNNEYLVDRMNYEAVEFIKRHKNEPFFLYLSHYAVHTTLDAKLEDIKYFSKKRRNFTSENLIGLKEKLYFKAEIDKFFSILKEFLNFKKIRKYFMIRKRWFRQNNPVLASMLRSIDNGVGDIVRILKELKLDQNTIIVFTSDNGGESRVTQNGHLRGGKSFTYEGGLRVNQIISYPGVTKRNSTTEFPTINLDFYPTFAEIIGYDIPKSHKLDGKSILPILKDDPKAEKLTKRILSWHYPLKRPHFLGGRSSAANRKENYKYIKFFDDGSSELYDLRKDESETVNLVNVYPEKADEHYKILKKWVNHVGGKVPKGQVL
ncbi:MAG: sulfatase [Candidatus Lokiarchaeota archaeon]|nr:sulfatase [Candidatus Lokiarchaeota archaeon]